MMMSTANSSLRASCSGRAAPLRHAAPVIRAIRRSAVVRAAATAFAPPPVSATKVAFLDNYSKPVPSIYNVVVQELLVQQHFMRYATNYEYNEVFALGVVSTFDQILEQMEDDSRMEIFNAYIRALGEDPEMYRRDAAKLEKAAEAMTSSDKLGPDGELEVQKALAKVQAKAKAGKFAQNKFFSIGLFRLLEITGAKEPSALEALVSAVGVKLEGVNKDLMLYKGILSKLSVAKELMKDFVEREKRKQIEREADKAARAAKAAAAEAVSASA